jgi:hypothetical protein
MYEGDREHQDPGASAFRPAGTQIRAIGAYAGPLSTLLQHHS